MTICSSQIIHKCICGSLLSLFVIQGRTPANSSASCGGNYFHEKGHVSGQDACFLEDYQ